MDFEKLTSRAQEALQKAQLMAQENGHQVLETSHLFLGLMEVDKDVVPNLLKQQHVNVNALTSTVRAILGRFPKVDGGELHASNALSTVLRSGISELKTWGDSYLAVDALFYHLCQSKDSLGSVIKDAGINMIQLKKDILKMRNGDQVQNANQENTYQSLAKF
ncbi:MAG: hypothetical protein FJZ80_08155, partial [Bacteroidetes bacterium]|nr:hypothetical protein [Bacteroidota bacterium]